MIVAMTQDLAIQRRADPSLCSGWHSPHFFA